MANTNQGLKPGTLLRHETYRIVRVLGQGGFGITYLANDLTLNRLVAIKEFFPKDFCDRESSSSHVTLGSQSAKGFIDKQKEKFLKEVRNIAKLDHPGIIRIHGAFEENNTAYYVMDYINGESLSEIVKSKGPLPESRAVGYIKKIGNALEYIHSKKINHLDVKPANIMVRRRDDTPILIDFGLSKQYDSAGNQTSTTPIGVSHGYAPMEQYNDVGVKEFSPQTDLYSLAATLYYMLSGATPPHATTLIEDELTFPSSIPSHLISPVSKAMSSKRRNRHETVAEFLREISETKSKDVSDNPNVGYDHNYNPYQDETSSLSFATESDPADEFEPDGNGLTRNRKVLMGIGAIVAVIVIIFFASPRGDKSNVIVPSEVDSISDPIVVKKDIPETMNRGTTNGHEWVDLGLPSGVKWATCNVGASNPSDYGDYYAWGETTTKSQYEVTNCFDLVECSLHYGDPEHTEWGVYKLDGDTVLTPDSGHDAARENWGGTWRMPTEEELKELIDCCNWEWSQKGGTNGFLVTGPKGNSIFLPAAGYRGAFVGGEGGNYWSSSLSPSTSDRACSLTLYKDYQLTSDGYRWMGRSVRAVLD